MDLETQHPCFFIEKVKKSPKPIVLFGASELGRQALQFFQNANTQVSHFCDNDSNKWGAQYKDIPIVDPSALVDISSTSYIVTSSSHRDAIEEQLKDAGITCDFHFKDADTEESNLIEKHEEEIAQAKSIFKDPLSIEVFETILCSRINGNLDLLRIILTTPQYFIKDILRFTDQEIFVDGGAYTGDTLNKFLLITYNKFKHIYAFEPDSRAYSELTKQTSNPALKTKVTYEKAGLYNKDTTLSFYVDPSLKSGSSLVSDSGGEKIKVLGLDNYLQGKPITFLKLDIEGSEIEALHGAKETILRHKPKLAICVYHKPTDLWEIPNLLKNWLPEYHFYLRHHSYSLNETVLYAHP